MSEALPQAFLERMAAQLGEELPAFLHSYTEPYCRGIRLNPLKPTAKGFWPKGVLEPVPWEPSAHYLTVESDAGADVLHEAGGWYLQEPSAMAAVAALNPQPGERVLDLCAAPGGKSTQIAGRMRGQGLLVSNEPVPKRAAILARNMERMGVMNALTVSALPDVLAARWPEAFDAVLVDAPCSGEGMFRRHPETRAEWTADSPAGCAKRQREILESAAKLVRPGGRLTYATCTLNPTENEENMAWFVETHPDFELSPYTLPGLGSCEGAMTLYPHRIRGEGHFVALLRRKGEAECTVAPFSGLKEADKTAAKTVEAFAGKAMARLYLLGDTMVQLPEGCPSVQGVKVLRAGLHVGQLRGKLFFPDHAWALAAQPPELPHVELSREEAAKYQAGEELAAENGAGFVLACYGGLTLGWGKVSEGRMKNHYPKGLRRNNR